MKKYIAKEGSWFVAGTEAELLDEYTAAGVFRGKRKCQFPKVEFHRLNEIYTDEQVLPYDEFEVIDEQEQKP